MWPQGISGYEWRGTAAACMAFVKSLPSWFRACVLWEGQTQIKYLRSHMCRPKNSHKQRPSPRLTQKRREIIKPQPSVYTIVMETADLSVPGAPGPSLGFEDYSVYTNLSDEELIQIAIERSLFSEDHNTTPSTGTRQTPCPPNAEVSRRSTPAHLHSTSTQPGSQRIDSSSTKPSPLQQPSVTTTALYSSPNPPTTKRVQRVEDPLFVAIRAGDVNRVRKLVNVPGWKQVSSINPDWLAIHQAAAYGQEACLRLLLSAQPGMVNKKAEKEQTALMLAVDNEHVDCVRLLLESGANPEIVNEDRETPLYKACERNNAKLVATLISHGAELNTPCILGFRALHEAVVQNNVEICELLVKAGAKLSPVNNYGMTPLCEAAQSGKLETLRFLVTHGADIDKQASDESTALYEAAKNDHENIVELLLSLDADASIPGRRGLLPLHIAAQKGSYSMVSMLMSATSKTRVRRTGISPLHLAAEYDHDDVLELLISAGFDPNAQLSTEWTKLYEDRRSTALYSSVFNNNLEAITMLLEAGANPNLDFFCPLLVAVRQGCVQTLRLLLEHGANVNAYVPLHRTSFPASILFSLKQLHVLKLLLDNGCDARSCFTCDYGSGPHPPIKVTRFERFGSDDTRDHYTQFCEIISMDSISRWAGPIIDVLLDYVGHVTLCSRLQEHLNSYPDWQGIKEKAAPPWRLMQLCRLKIRQQVGIQRLRDIETLPLPGTLIRFLQYQQEASVDEPQESWEHWQDMNSWS